jgi:hypothetical protein
MVLGARLLSRALSVWQGILSWIKAWRIGWKILYDDHVLQGARNFPM